jgi:tetratricopeptide (TPR) repeat protein
MIDVLSEVTRRGRWTGPLVVLLLGWLPGIAHAQAQTIPGSRVLVMPFEAVVDPDAPGASGAALWLGEAGAILTTEGLGTLGVGALSRDDRVAAFDELDLPMTPALTRATMIRVGELIGASEVVFGQVHLGSQLSVEAHLIRLAAGRAMPVVIDQGPLSDIFQIFGRVAGRLASETGRLRPAAVAATRTLPLDAFENYVKGLVATAPAVQQRFLESAARQAPTDGRILMALWGAYAAQGFTEKALASANAVTGDPALVRRARFAVALSLIELKRYDGAFQTLNALYAGGHAGTISNALGVVQLRRGTPAGGVAPSVFFKRALEDDPENADYLFNLGYAQALAQNATDALGTLREAVRFNAADGEAHLVMSAVLTSAGRTAEAQREFDLARLLGAAPGSAGRAPAARIPTGLERLPTSPELGPALPIKTLIANPGQRDQRETAAFHLASGKALMAADRDRDAVNELRRAISLAPYQDEPHLLLGQLYQRDGRLPEAIDEFKVAIWSRETPEARLALAGALFEAGQPDAARTEASRALTLAPGSKEAQDLLRRIGG